MAGHFKRFPCESPEPAGRRNGNCCCTRVNKRLPVALALLVASATLLRADGEKLALLKAGSEEFVDVTVTSVTATDIYFSHSRGLGNAKLKNLDPALQQRFHFNPAAAAEKEKQQLEAQARYVQARKEAKPPPPAPRADEDEAQGGATDEVEPHEITAKSFLNRPAPGIVAEKWLTEPPNLIGKFILVDFWATWCSPCRRSIPKLNAFSAKFKDKLVVLGLSDETEQEVRRMTEPRIEYSIAFDSHHRASAAFGVERIPHAVLIDPQGIVRFEGHPGYLSERTLEKLLASQPN
jgi:cytochrome c biogenesis protein CcmG, thiol:disulfide interchange protein DsbE